MVASRRRTKPSTATRSAAERPGARASVPSACSLTVSLIDARLHLCTIGPERFSCFCPVLDPSYLVLVVRYGSTLSLVTNSSPVLVSGGATRPPDSLYIHRNSTGRKPCR